MTEPTMIPVHAFGRTQWRCTGCGLTYGLPTSHEPGSQDCNDAARERARSVSS